VQTPDRHIAVLASGTGSILEAMLRESVPVAVVIADRECRALEIAAEAGIPTELLERGDFGPNFDREGYTERLEHLLDTYRIDIVAMAGFMTFLSPRIFTAYGGRILNTHPSLLPDFKGEHAVRDALAAGVKETGCTVHVATEKMDDGAILAREKVAVMPDDTVESLHERIKEKERILYPRVLKDLLSGAIVL
jgi:phosphoribosylglycinamide formyltransferase-1